MIRGDGTLHFNRGIFLLNETQWASRSGEVILMDIFLYQTLKKKILSPLANITIKQGGVFSYLQLDILPNIPLFLYIYLFSSQNFQRPFPSFPLDILPCNLDIKGRGYFFPFPFSVLYSSPNTWYYLKLNLIYFSGRFREAAKKSSFFNGSAIKERGGGYRPYN